MIKKTMTAAQKRKMEAEHVKSKKGQDKIIKDHEKEFGKAYYPALKKMEGKLKKRGKSK
jgi:hypothetical protein